MKVLLDTQIFLWVLDDSRRLGKRQRAIIERAERRFVSLASAWEVAIKAGLGKIRIPQPFDLAIASNGFEPLHISFSHVAAVQHLPLHHRDPFDRMLVAQAMVDGLTLISADRNLASYGIPLIEI